MNDQPSCLGTVKVRICACMGYRWVHLHGFNPFVFFHGPYHVMFYTSTGHNSHAKNDVPNVPLVNPLPFSAKVNDLVPVQRTALSVHQPKDSNHLPLFVWILLAPSLLSATVTRRLVSCGPAGLQLTKLVSLVVSGRLGGCPS